MSTTSFSPGMDNALQHRGKMGSTEDSDRKKRSLNNHGLPVALKKQAVSTASQNVDEKKVDPNVLQFQNTKLSQQLEIQKLEIHDLEEKCRKAEFNQARFDDALMRVHRVWNQLQEDLELLTVRVGRGTEQLDVLNGAETMTADSSRMTTLSPDETFLYRLVESGATESSSTADSIYNSFEASLQTRKNKTMKTLGTLIQAIERQREHKEQLLSKLSSMPPSSNGTAPPDHMVQVTESLRSEILSVQNDMDALHLKHREIAKQAMEFEEVHIKDGNAIKRLTGELEEAKFELEQARRKLVGMKNQQVAANGPLSTPGSLAKAEPSSCSHHNEDGAPSKEAKDLRMALDEAKSIAEKRLAELQEANEVHANLQQELRIVQARLHDERHVQQSQAYMALTEQLQSLRHDLERCRAGNADMQRERDLALVREKEMLLRAEAGDLAKRASSMLEAKTMELERKLHDCMVRRDELQRELETSVLASGRMETRDELKAMNATLHKEMRMVQGQLDKYKGIAQDVHALRADVHALQSSLMHKAKECEELANKCSVQENEIMKLKEELKVVSESEQELGFFLDSFERDITDTREVAELKQAEWRALAHVERLKAELDEHSLALRVKAANEEEAVCQQRLARAEAEIADLRGRLGQSERAVVELTGKLEAKNEEVDVYMAEIETIGQAYEDMQRQNERLLSQLTDRDEYNTQLMSESVKARQLQSSLMAEKEEMATRMTQANSAVELQRTRVAQLEDRVRVCLEQLSKATEEVRHFAGAVEASKRRTVEVEAEAGAAKAALEATHKEMEERTEKAAEAAAELERERFKRKRKEEELDALSHKIARVQNQQEKGGLVDDLQEEIKFYKSILRCGVCHDRQKEVVITKCFHLFCNPCIQKNLEIRHRKCPGCGVPFGQNDVRTVYI